MDIKQFAQAVGRQSIADAVGLGVTAVHMAVLRGKFPPAWFHAVEGLSEQRGVECPRDLFGFLHMAAPCNEGPLACDRNNSTDAGLITAPPVNNRGES